MAEITLEALGLKAEDIADRVVNRIVEKMLSDSIHDEWGDEAEKPSAFRKALQARMIAQINKSIEEIAAKHVLPNITQYLETFCLQETNSWGEKKGKPVTFVEYLVQRADAYMKEEVDYSGKSKAEDSYNWRKNTTRVAYLIHEHLQYNITRAMKEALQTANNSIVGGIQKAVQVSLSNLKITVNPPTIKD